MEQDNQFLASVGGVLVGLALLSTMQVVPGWEFFDAGLPNWIYFVIGPLLCAAGFYLSSGRKYPIPAIAAGAIGGLGGMLAVCAMLHVVEWVHSVMLAAAGIAGALPGLGIGWFLKLKLHDADDRADARRDFENDVARQLGWSPSDTRSPSA